MDRFGLSRKSGEGAFCFYRMSVGRGFEGMRASEFWGCGDGANKIDIEGITRNTKVSSL